MMDTYYIREWWMIEMKHETWSAIKQEWSQTHTQMPKQTLGWFQQLTWAPALDAALRPMTCTGLPTCQPMDYTQCIPTPTNPQTHWPTKQMLPLHKIWYLLEPTVMFIGLTNSLATFQTMMNSIFTNEIAEKWLTVYMDDMAIHTSRRSGETEEQHVQRHRIYIKWILTKLMEHNLFLKPEKM